jgi:membrane-associated phospholipid phosphatase
VLCLPLHALAALVTYSRVHTGVPYPVDVIAGAVIGAATGQIVIRLADRRSVDVTEPATIRPLNQQRSSQSSPSDRYHPFTLR